MCCPLSHGYQWCPSCSSHNCKQISQFSPTQTQIWCLPVGISGDFRTVFSMAFSRHMHEWLFPSYSFVFTFSSLLAFCLLPLLFLFSLGMNFATLYLWSLFLHFSFFFSNLSLVSPFPFLSFFLASKEVENLCLPLKSLSLLSRSTRCIPCLRSYTALAFHVLFHFFCLGWRFCPPLSLSLWSFLSLSSLLSFLNMKIVFNLFSQKCIFFNFWIFVESSCPSYICQFSCEIRIAPQS